MDVARPNGLEHCSDADLVRLLVAGNHEAMTVIFDRYYRLVMSVAIRMLHDVAEAEDVVQIVFSLGRSRNPDFWKPLREQQVEDEPGIALVGLLLAHFAGANLGGVSDPQLVAQFREQAHEPVDRTGGFDAHANCSL